MVSNKSSDEDICEKNLSLIIMSSGDKASFFFFYL